MSKITATFYHAGCPVCLDAETAVTRYLDQTLTQRSSTWEPQRRALPKRSRRESSACPR